MPIFISRFSPERSLIGSFLSTRSRQNVEGTEASQQSRRRSQNTRTEAVRGTEPDRLELSQAARLDAANAAQSSRTAETGTRPSAEVPDAAGELQGAPTQGNRIPGNLTIDPNAAAVEFNNQRENRAAAQSATPGRLEALLNRLGGFEELQDQADPTQANLQLAIQRENLAAVQNAAPERLQDFLNSVDDLAEAQNAAGAPAEGELPIADGSQQGGEAALENPETLENVEPQSALLQGAPVQPLPRQIQEQELQRNLQTIASGLRNDAAIESRRNAAQTARNTQRASAQQQRQEVRKNQTQVRSLQADRRRLQQQAQRTDQAIRQLQNRSARLQNSNGSSAAPRTSIDLLAQ